MTTCAPELLRKPESLPVVPARLNVVIFYDTVEAGRDAFITVGRIAGITDDELVPICFQPWRHDFMQDADSFETVLRDVRDAGMIVVAANGVVPLSSTFKEWLTAFLELKKGQDSAVVVLSAHAQANLHPDSPDFAFLKNLALEAELDFFSPTFGAAPLLPEFP